MLIDGLQAILDDLEAGVLTVDPACEDIHMFVEQVLTERIGETGKKLHTARSRNDQVALDTRMYLRDEIDTIVCTGGRPDPGADRAGGAVYRRPSAPAIRTCSVHSP